MNNLKRAGILFLLIFLLQSICIAEKRDLLYLANGNIITGEIKKIQFGILYYKTDDIGTLSVKWKDVRKLKSDGQFELTMSDQNIIYGSIDTTSNSREIVLVTDNDRIVIDMNKLVSAVYIKNTFLSRVDGNIKIGLNYTKGSGIVGLNLSGSATYRSLHDLVSISENSNFTWNKKNEPVNTIMKNDLTTLYARYFKKRWFVLGLFSLEQNTELGLNLRISGGAGCGKELFENHFHSFNTAIGIVGSHEYPVTGIGTNNAEGIVFINYKIYKYSHPKVVFESKVFTLPSFTNLGRVRLNSNVSMDIEFVKDFTIGISGYQNFDNRPSSEGASKFDWGINTSIGYSF